MKSEWGKEKKKDRPAYSAAENVLFLWKRIGKVYPMLLVMMGIQCVFSIIGPVAGIYLPRIAVELAQRRAELSEIMLELGGMGLILFLSMALSSMANMGKYMMLNNIRFEYMRQLFMDSLSCGYDQIESVEGQRKYGRARGAVDCGDSAGTTTMCNGVIELFINLGGFAIYSGIISMLDVRVILLLVGLSLVNLLAVRYANGYEFRQKDEEAGLSNKLNYISGTANDVQYGKDIRLYGMAEWFPQIQEQVLSSYTRLSNKIKNRYLGAGIVNGATVFLRDGIAYAYLIAGVAAGKITVGDFVLYFGAVTGFSAFVGNIADNLNRLHKANLKMNDMRAFFDEAEKGAEEKEAFPSPGSRAGTRKKKKEADSGPRIDFENVTFSYGKSCSSPNFGAKDFDEKNTPEPDREPVLKNFTLHIRGGERVALVGVNGAGKTTVVKLLCGFYRPDEGRILIDGRDIREFGREELFALFSTVFQDIYIAPFTVAENVSMQPERDTDMERVIRCLKEVGLYEKICEYPEGIHAYMQKAVHDGIVLSGGQQQKLLMARALYKDAPVLILDEPTAALDPVAESETYEDFHRFSGGKYPFGKTAVYISHRLASTRFCDRIVLLEDGRIKEGGTHDELMKKGGAYARMFEIQSQYYKKDSMEEVWIGQ